MSPSQATGYARCPRLYAIERRLRIGDPTSVYMQLGNMVHQALEYAEAAVLGSDASHNTLEAALDVLRGVWENADFGTPQQNRAWLAKAERILTKLYTTWPHRGGRPVAVEKKVSLEIDGVTWKGVIDRLEETAEGLRVIDYKTGGTPLSKEEAATSIQLAFYAMAMNAEAGQPNVVAAELWFPAARGQSVAIRSLDLARLPEIEEAMHEITEQIAAENWEPRVSDACGKCPHRSSCPAWPEGRGAYVA